MDALREYNAGKQAWCSPRRGTPAHAEVLAIRRRLDAAGGARGRARGGARGRAHGGARGRGGAAPLTVPLAVTRRAITPEDDDGLSDSDDPFAPVSPPGFPEKRQQLLAALRRMPAGLTQSERRAYVLEEAGRIYGMRIVRGSLRVNADFSKAPSAGPPHEGDLAVYWGSASGDRAILAARAAAQAVEDDRAAEERRVLAGARTVDVPITRPVVHTGAALAAAEAVSAAERRRFVEVFRAKAVAANAAPPTGRGLALPRAGVRAGVAYSQSWPGHLLSARW